MLIKKNPVWQDLTKWKKFLLASDIQFREGINILFVVGQILVMVMI